MVICKCYNNSAAQGVNDLHTTICFKWHYASFHGRWWQYLSGDLSYNERWCSDAHVKPEDSDPRWHKAVSADMLLAYQCGAIPVYFRFGSQLYSFSTLLLIATRISTWASVRNFLFVQSQWMGTLMQASLRSAYSMRGMYIDKGSRSAFSILTTAIGKLDGRLACSRQNIHFTKRYYQGYEMGDCFISYQLTLQ